jgi:hypothetical protein
VPHVLESVPVEGLASSLRTVELDVSTAVAEAVGLYRTARRAPTGA